MAIKTVTSEVTDIELGYPKLMKSNDCNLIVLFVKPEEGTVIVEDMEERPWRVGYYDDKWAESCFEDYTGTVELTNKVGE